MSVGLEKVDLGVLLVIARGEYLNETRRVLDILLSLGSGGVTSSMLLLVVDVLRTMLDGLAYGLKLIEICPNPEAELVLHQDLQIILGLAPGS